MLLSSTYTSHFNEAVEAIYFYLPAHYAFNTEERTTETLLFIRIAIYMYIHCYALR